MRAFAAVAAAVLFAASGARAGDHDPPTVTYTPSGSRALPRGPFLVSAKVTGARPVFPKLFFRYQPGPFEKAVDMKLVKGPDTYEASIPYGGDSIEFYVEAFDEAGNGPARAGSPNWPLRVSLTEPSPWVASKTPAPPISPPPVASRTPAPAWGTDKTAAPPWGTGKTPAPAPAPAASAPAPAVSAWGTGAPAAPASGTGKTPPPAPALAASAPVPGVSAWVTGKTAAPAGPSAAPSVASKPPAPAPAIAAKTSEAATARPASGGGGRVLTWVAGGLGVGLLAGGAVAGLALKSGDDAYAQALANIRSSGAPADTVALASQMDANHALGTKATILAVSGAALLAASVALFFLESP